MQNCVSLQGSVSTSGGEVFDAVVVCNGHYSDPRRPEIPGMGEFPGRLLHSHSYRQNTPFAGMTVVVIGASASGEDISREIALVADKVRCFPCSHVRAFALIRSIFWRQKLPVNSQGTAKTCHCGALALLALYLLMYHMCKEC